MPYFILLLTTSVTGAITSPCAHISTGARRAVSYPGITSVSAGGTYPPACIVGTSVSSETQDKQQPLTQLLQHKNWIKLNFHLTKQHRMVYVQQ